MFHTVQKIEITHAEHKKETGANCSEVCGCHVPKFGRNPCMDARQLGEKWHKISGRTNGFQPRPTELAALALLKFRVGSSSQDDNTFLKENSLTSFGFASMSAKTFLYIIALSPV